MFSYRHAFHAGNHADVLKHLVLLEVLQYACVKEASLFYIDTHAGAALYALDRAEGQKNREYESGIGKLWGMQNLPASFSRYMDIVRELNPGGRLRNYPGSPYFAEKILREQDRLRLFELHSSENRILAKNFREIESRSEKKAVRGRRVIIESRDGFSALKGLLPPPSRRAVILIDPPYEDKQDYARVIQALEDSFKRFPGGCYLIWYPVLQRMEARRFYNRLGKMRMADWLDVRLTVREAGPAGSGLYGSGVFILNPPWKLKESLETLMPQLTDILGQDSQAAFTLESGSKEQIRKDDED